MDDTNMHIMSAYCQGCRCLLKQNMPRLHMLTKEDASHGRMPWNAAGQTGYRNSYDETKGHWFGGASVLNVSHANGSSSVGQGVLGAQSCGSSFSSTGSLVCSSDAMSASPSGGLLKESHDDYRLHYDNHLVYPGHGGGTNQALRRDVQLNAEVYQGLDNLYSSAFPPFGMQFPSADIFPGVDGSANAVAHDFIAKDTFWSQSPYNFTTTTPFLDSQLGPMNRNENTWIPWNADLNRFNMGELVDGAAEATIPEPASNTQSSAFANIGNIDWESVPGISIQSPSSEMATPATAAVTEMLLVSDNTPEDAGASPERAPDSSLSPSNAEADSHSPNSRESSASRTSGIVKVFPCLHEGCDYTAANRRDLMRHLRTKKHSRRSAVDDVEIPVPQQTFRCSRAACNYASHRRDNWIRHIWKVHKVRVERQQPGRRPSGRRLGPSSPQRGRSP
ncbi:MT-A70-domain-containing protein [Apiospora arundinis]